MQEGAFGYQSNVHTNPKPLKSPCTLFKVTAGVLATVPFFKFFAKPGYIALDPSVAHLAPAESDGAYPLYRDNTRPVSAQV
jgi:hypothetical protein